MARQRRPVQSLQDSLSPRLAPQAAPVSLAPTIAPPADLPLFDFAAISGTIAGYMRRQQEERSKVLQQKGEMFAEENRLVMADLQQDLAGVDDPEERHRIQQGAFALLRKQGEVPDMADPDVRVGLERANGRIMVGQYWQNLQRRLPEVSTVTNPDGTPAEPLDAERVMAEEWEKIAKAPAVKGFYGGQEALAQKVNADAQFLQAVTQRRSQAEKVHYEGTIAQEWGKAFDSILDQHDVVTEHELKPLSVLVAQEVRDHNMLAPREVLLNALELSIKRWAAVGPAAAVRAAEAAEDIVIGGVRLGDDRSGVGERLLELKRQVRLQANEAADDELKNEDIARRLAVQKGQADYVPLLLQAKRDGQSVRQVARELETRYMAEDRFDGREAFVVRSMQEFAQQLEQDVSSDPAVIHDINRLIASGRLDEARTLNESALASGALDGSSYGQNLDVIRKRGDISQYMEDNNQYRDVVASIDQSTPRGFVPEVQDRFEQQALDLKDRFNQDLEAFIQSTEGQPNREALIRKERARLGAAYREVLVKAGTEQRAKQNEALRSISQLHARFQDAEDVIAQAEREGALTLDAADKAREANRAAAAGRENLVHLAHGEAAALLDARLQALFGGAPTDQADITLQSEAHRNLRDQLGLGIDAMIADPANDPRTFESRARATARKVVDEIGDTMFPEGAREAVKSELQAGAEATEVQARQAKLGAQRTLADSVEGATDDPVLREHLKASHPIFAPAAETGGGLRVPGVPDRFYDYAAAWWSQRDPIFGTPVRRADMDRQVIELSYALGAAPDRDAVLAGALDVVGMDAVQVLKGEAVLEPAPASRALIEQTITRMEAQVAAGLAPRGSIEPHLRTLRRHLDPVRVALEGHEFKPFVTAFFRSEAALDTFADDPAFPEFLRRIGINPDSQDEVDEWQSFQRLAIARSNR